MTIRQRLAISFLSILALFAVNLGVYFWSSRARDRSVEELRRALDRQLLLASIGQRIGDLKKQVELTQQVTPETSKTGIRAEEIASFRRQVDDTARLAAQLRNLSVPGGRTQATAFEQTFRKLGKSWIVFYEHLGVSQTKAIIELTVRAEPLGQETSSLLPTLEQDERRRVTAARANFSAVSRLTDRITVLLFILSSIVATGVAYGLSSYLNRGLGELQHGTAEIGGGHLAHRIPVTRVDELGALARAFNQMTDRLEVTNHRLVESEQRAMAATEAKSSFLASMSHEIRTPMNAIIGMSSLLGNTELTAEQREFVQIVRGSSEALLTIINDILDFSKIEAGRMELEEQPFDLRECIESALDLVATRSSEKGLELAYFVNPESPAVIAGDVTRVRQILINLLNNAVKFTEQGEIVLSVESRKHEQNQHEMHFAVRDTGIGIPPERMDRLFQSFSQVDASTTRRYGGTGLGLAICKRLTEMMGGTTWAESEGLGRGATFHVSIHAEACPELVGRRRLLESQPNLEGKRVLIVDDNATNRRMLELQTRSWGMVPIDTEFPLEALRWIEQGDPFDLVVLDMQMPQMDGVGLASEIRRHRDATQLPLLLCSSIGERISGPAAAHFAGQLSKPVKASTLFNALADVLGGATEREVRAPATGEFDPELGRTHPLRILVAEDNAVNQKVALRLLERMGYTADLASNGLEALQSIERQCYDVVLMDVEMPEMDGLEATHQICQRWSRDARPRLVAMTANAMAGDRERFLKAGMDDYVSKPIRVEELVAALRRCDAQNGQPPQAPNLPAATAPVPSASALDPATLAEMRSTMGDDFFLELIDVFLEDALHLLDDLRQGVERASLDLVRRTAHSLKSNSANVGALALSEACREAEEAARLGQPDGMAERVERIVLEWTRAQTELKTLSAAR